MQVEKTITKRIANISCRVCGGRLIAKVVCLDCNEVSIGWCEPCFKLAEFCHDGHSELHLF